MFFSDLPTNIQNSVKRLLTACSVGLRRRSAGAGHLAWSRRRSSN